jgi:bifunctional non-homologous end joining protein LigD
MPAESAKSKKRSAAKHAASRTTKHAPEQRKLRVYRKKRNFERTREPSGDAHHETSETRIFVVQKHAARRLHYDFRLELDGVLLSWSVPKGPSLLAGERRLAVRTEDHPIDYAGFEGTIPKGEYGGGTVIVWDRGTWTPSEDPARGMKKGRLTFELHGEKLHGRFHLVRMPGDDKHENWLLFKSDDAAATHAKGQPSIVERAPKSVLSGLTIEQLANGVSARAKAKNPAKAKPSAPRAAKRAHESQQSGSARTGQAEVLELVSKLPVPFAFTNLARVLYPEQGLRKAELVAYLASVSEWMLPHVGRRPLTLVRCPEGRQKHCFFQKHPRQGLPEVVRRIPIREERKTADYLYVSDLAGLLALVQNGVLEIHTWGCHIDRVERPDQLVFDLDPDEALPFSATSDAAFELRERLHALGLTSFLKTTGGKGLHVVVPLLRRHTWDEHKAFARGFVEQMARETPALFVTEAKKSLRKGRVFLDYLRNGRGATAVAPYSPRAREGAPVATPLTREELQKAKARPSFDVSSVLERLSTLKQDPWHDYGSVKQGLPLSVVRQMSR